MEAKINEKINEKIKACIFDLDGTLTDTLTSIAYSTNRMLMKEGLKPLPRENYRFYAGNGAAELVKACLRDTARMDKDALMQADPGTPGAGEKLQRDPDALLHDPKEAEDFPYYYKRYLDEFSQFCMYQVKAFDGIKEALTALKQNGVRIAVLSNKPDAQVQDVVGQVFGNDFFDEVRGQREGVPRKPSPVGALQIAEHFGVRPAECLYFGDTDTDMQTGTAAGMHSVGVLWGFRSREELLNNHAVSILEKPAEILELFKKINRSS